MMATRELGLTARCEARPELRQAARSARIIFHIRRVVRWVWKVASRMVDRATWAPWSVGWVTQVGPGRHQVEPLL